MYAEIDSYETAHKRLGNRTSRKLCNNTYLKRREDDAVAIMLHQTDVVTYFADGTVILNSGGWLTVTTKDRMNRFSPLQVWSERGVWYVALNNTGATFAYQDGLTWRGGEFSGVGPDPAETRKLRVSVRRYASDFVAALIDGDVPMPSGGDCWICLVPGKDKNHILSHIEEKYYVPSLLLRAIESFKPSKAVCWAIGERWGQCEALLPLEDTFITAQVRKLITRQCYRQLGLAG